MADPDDSPLFEEIKDDSPKQEEPTDSANGELENDSKEDEPKASAESAPASIPVDIEPELAETKDSKKSEEEDEEETDSFDESDLRIKVSNPEKIGEGMSAYMVYEVSTSTSLPSFKSSETKVKRRFSDFLGLHERLAEKHLVYGRIVPPAPDKAVVDKMKGKMSKGEETGEDAFLGRRKQALERYMNRTAKHPKLREDADFKEFLEAEALPKATHTSAFSKGGFSRLVKNVGEAMSKMTMKIDEQDQWFEEKHNQIEALEQQLKKLHVACESLVTLKKEVVMNTTNFAKSASLLSSSEEDTGLSRALSQLAELEEKMEQLHNDQSRVDFFVLCETLKEYIGLVMAVKAIFHQRYKVYQNWQSAQATLTKKREALVKLELAGKQEKIAPAQEEVKEWERKVEKGQEDFEEISKTVKKEFKRFEIQRVKDFKDLIIKYLKSLMECQQKMVKCWEEYLPEAKAIA